jgi:hypothetical protein
MYVYLLSTLREIKFYCIGSVFFLLWGRHLNLFYGGNLALGIIGLRVCRVNTSNLT